MATPDLIRSLLQEAATTENENRFTLHFLYGEWSEVVDARQLKTWEAYRDVPHPLIGLFDNADEEIESVGAWIAARIQSGLQPHEIGVFVRSNPQLERARTAVEAAGTAGVVLRDDVTTVVGRVSISTMHLAKGLEFRAVVVMVCDDEIVPSQDHIETVSDEPDLEDTYNTERHLLYVACTRARDDLLVTGVDPASEFFDDLLG